MTATSTTAIVAQTRSLTSAADQVQATAIQNAMVRRAVLFRAELEMEVQREMLAGGFSVADLTTAQATIIAAIKAVLW